MAIWIGGIEIFIGGEQMDSIFALSKNELSWKSFIFVYSKIGWNNKISRNEERTIIICFLYLPLLQCDKSTAIWISKEEDQL